MRQPTLAPELAPLIYRCRILWLIAASAVFYVAEGLVTLPFPWLRLGLSNLFVLIAARRLGFSSAILVSIGRTVLGSIATGQLLSPVFIINLGGALPAALFMGALCRLPWISFVGVSSLAAVVHVVGQLLVATWLLNEPTAVLGLAPILLTIALISGPVVGYMAEIADGFIAREAYGTNKTH
jgi:heptaprenyl diphosphate synthase